ncbi:hypothetical protein CBM2592_B10034 [Cupriavidus taiwanensis]|nr:hypothetical protein CBM2588_B10034 [Cupriavidus taiwanensis]SOY59770.1 hypothetical protein CBM2592_B10034 [Cupriavidus taiwanensis]SOY91810.1 hypothetical protein CBM2591_B10034 [Cupriavidus taiwanensis]SOZ73471.1 hypothetical protein CBM2617_B190034 [Cupriavidus taiwanensis]SOZ83360.1 hypothetical protein CBM2618_B10034 [Cupriavidus taiwanensis]
MREQHAVLTQGHTPEIGRPEPRMGLRPFLRPGRGGWLAQVAAIPCMLALTPSLQPSRLPGSSRFVQRHRPRPGQRQAAAPRPAAAVLRETA